MGQSKGMSVVRHISARRNRRTVSLLRHIAFSRNAPYGSKLQCTIVNGRWSIIQLSKATINSCSKRRRCSSVVSMGYLSIYILYTACRSIEADYHYQISTADGGL